jgi:hypothetical protein
MLQFHGKHFTIQWWPASAGDDVLLVSTNAIAMHHTSHTRERTSLTVHSARPDPPRLADSPFDWPLAERELAPDAECSWLDEDSTPDCRREDEVLDGDLDVVDSIFSEFVRVEFLRADVRLAAALPVVAPAASRCSLVADLEADFPACVWRRCCDVVSDAVESADDSVPPASSRSAMGRRLADEEECLGSLLSDLEGFERAVVSARSVSR